MRRALTMIELLLAVSLLSLITLSAAAWTQIAARSRGGAIDSAHWRAAAATVLQRVDEDLLVGDFDGARDPASGSQPPTRVRVRDGALEIQTRDLSAQVGGGGTGHQAKGGGPIVHIYRLDGQTGHLEQVARGNSRDIVRPLLHDVASFDCNLDAKRMRFEVVITSTNNLTVKRTYQFQ